MTGRAFGALRATGRLLGQAWLILGITLLLLLMVDQILRAVLPKPVPMATLEPGAIAPGRSRAAAVADDDWIDAYWNEHQASRHTQWESYVYWRRKPYDGELIDIDAHGFRVTPPARTAPLRTIWLFGGSTAWGTGNRNEGTLAAQLQRIYAERAPELAVRVLNFGESGYVSRQSLAAFQSALACPQPPADLAIFLDGANDVFAALQEGQAGLPQNEENRRREFNSSRQLGAQLRAWALRLEGIAGLLQSAPPAAQPAALDALAAPLWTRVDGSQASCGSCHGNPPPAPHPSDLRCELCHLPTAGSNQTIADASTHLDGIIQVTAGCDGWEARAELTPTGRQSGSARRFACRCRRRSGSGTFR